MHRTTRIDLSGSIMLAMAKPANSTPEEKVEQLREVIREANGAKKDLTALIKEARTLTEEYFDAEVKKVVEGSIESIEKGVALAIGARSDEVVAYFDHLVKRLVGEVKSMSGGKTLEETVALVVKHKNMTGIHVCDMCTRSVSNMDIWTHWCATEPSQIPEETRAERVAATEQAMDRDNFILGGKVSFMYERSVYMAIPKQYTEDPRWRLCPECHDIALKPNTTPRDFVKQWAAHAETAWFPGAELEEKKILVRIGLAFFWYWRRTDMIEEPGTYR